MRKRKGERTKERGECEEEEMIEEVRKWREWGRGEDKGDKEEESVRKRKGERRKETGECEKEERIEEVRKWRE